MTSLEIAALTGKRHDNVMRDARSMLTELYGFEGLLRFEDTHRNPQNGQEYPCVRLPRTETMILVTGYSIPMRAAVVRRLEELEAQVASPVQVPQTLAQALRLAADQAERIETLQAENAVLRIEAAPETFGLTFLEFPSGAKLRVVTSRKGVFMVLSEVVGLAYPNAKAGRGYGAYVDQLPATQRRSVSRSECPEAFSNPHAGARTLVTPEGLLIMFKQPHGYERKAIALWLREKAIPHMRALLKAAQALPVLTG
jgi:phage regulator Rha-like protein